MNLVIAAAATSQAALVERLRHVPREFWFNLAIGLLAVVVAVIVLRKIAKMNRLILVAGLFLVATFVGVNWIYERNEPSWATPVVQILAGFLPTKVRVHI